VPEESRESAEGGVMTQGLQRQYMALTGIEVATAGAKLATNLMLSIPGMNSRLTTFPRVKLTVTVRIEAFDREPVEVTDMNDLIERLVLEGAEQAYEGETAEYSATLDEETQSADSIRKGAGLVVTKPTLNEITRQITDAPADPLPAGENLGNVQQFGKPGGATLADGTHYSGRGRVIENETVGLTSTGDVGANPIREKLKGSPDSTHFRVRTPGGR
jgi:hypothetical protein